MAVGSDSASKVPESKAKISDSDAKNEKKSPKQPESSCLSPPKSADRIYESELSTTEPTAEKQLATVAVGSDSASELPESKAKISESDAKKDRKSRKQPESSCLSPAKSGARINDSENWKTCHQCRQKTMHFVSACKNQKKDKQCTIKFCHKCLMNRYGEKAEEIAVLENWNCPKCRGICNCSCCRKKQGHRPTGILVHAARATGFSSVSELLHVKGPENFGINKIVKSMDIGVTNAAASNKEPAITSPGKGGKENSFCGNNNTNLHPIPLRSSSLAKKKQKKMKHEGSKEMQDGIEFINTSIPLPQGTALTTVAGIDLPPEDVGHVLQFLEFCASFEEILELKEGEPEYVLRELIDGGRVCRERYSPVVWFHIQLLSMIQKDLGEKSPVITSKDGKNSWLRTLQNCASRSQFTFQKLKLEQFGWEADDYDSLDSSKKLRLLNFLCDEFLCTAKIRSWMDDQNSKFAGEVKDAKERVLAAKHKVKQLKQKMQDDVAKAISEKDGVPLSISEHEAIVSQIKTESAQAHAEMLESKSMVPKDKQRYALRTQPILVDVDGHTYWRLRGYSGGSNLLLQDMESRDPVESDDKWFTYDAEQEKEIEKNISGLRKKRLRSEEISDGFSSKSNESETGFCN